MFFISKLASDPRSYIMWVTVIMFSICFHEFAHAYVALKQGDSTAADEGHLTMNPMVQMGTFSIIMLFVIGISWGAVPVNPRRMRNKYSHALVSFAGPASNLILFVVFSLICSVFVRSGNQIYTQMFFEGAKANMLLFSFNMLPIPILDGWAILQYFIPKIDNINTEVKNGMTFVLFILFMMTPLFSVFYFFCAVSSEGLINFFANIL